MRAGGMGRNKVTVRRGEIWEPSGGLREAAFSHQHAPQGDRGASPTRDADRGFAAWGSPAAVGPPAWGGPGPHPPRSSAVRCFFWGGVSFPTIYTPTFFFFDSHPLNFPLGRLSGFSRLHGNLNGRLQPGQRSLFPHESQPSIRSPQHPLESGPRRSRASAQPGARRLRGHLPGGVPW